MNRSKIIFFIFILLTCSGCLYNYPATTNQKEKKTISVQQRSEDTVKKHILDHFKNKGEYTGYTFSELLMIKPREILELDQLREVREKLPKMKENYSGKLDSVIVATDTAIEKKI